MGPAPARSSLLFGLLALIARDAEAQTLRYDFESFDLPTRALDYEFEPFDLPTRPLIYEVESLLPVEKAPFDPGQDEGALSILGVNINGRDLDATTVMAVRGGTALVPIDDIRSWRLRSTGTGAVDVDGQRYAPLASVQGLKFRVDTERQVLVIDVPLAAFEATKLNAATEPPKASPAATTAFFNYDLSLEHSGGSTVGGAFLEMGVSGSPGLLTNTMLLNSGSRSKTAVRLDTTAIRDDPSGLTRLTIGDTLSRGSSWAPQTRFGGIRYGTDFTLQPGFLSFPTPTFNGEAALPSNVEVYINNVLRYQNEVDRGPFGLDQLPLLAGSGEVTLHVRDALGIDRTVVADYYVSTRLLRPGLSEYSLELGAERRNYGRASFDYAQPFLAGTHRYGVATWLTTEGRVELARDLQMIGGGLATTVGGIGEAGFSLAGSRSPFGTGFLYRIYASRISPRWSVNASYQSATEDYASIGLSNRRDRPRTILQVSAGMSLGAWGNINASESRIRRADDVETRVSAFNYSRRLGRLGNVTAFVIRSTATEVNDATIAGLSFSLSLGENRSAYAQADTGTRRIEYQKQLPSDQGFGYRLSASQGERDQQGADLSYRGRAVDLVGQAVRIDGATGFRGMASGGFLLAEGSVFPTRRLDSAFAIVDTDGQKNVRVFQDNREVNRTNGRGIAIVSQLRPYETNRIAVASDDLPLDTAIKNDTLAVVPRFFGGVLAKFSIGQGRAGTLVIELPDGSPLEPGTPIALEAGGEGTYSGYGGEVFIEDLTAGMVVTAQRNAGACRITVPAFPADDTLPRVGPIRCIPAGQ